MGNGAKGAGAGIGTVLAVILLILWGAGRLDTTLAPYGMNRNPCVQSYLNGAYYCGDAAVTFCQQFGCDQP